MPVSYIEPSSTHPLRPPPPAPSRWGPYSSPADPGTNVVIILVIVLGALALVFALNAAIRHLLCSSRRRRGQSHGLPDPEEKRSDEQAPPPTTASLLTSTFSAGTELAGTGAECSICLGELVDGDGVSVLPACSHGFHTGCIEKWIASRKSCPTCRASCNVVP